MQRNHEELIKKLDAYLADEPASGTVGLEGLRPVLLEMYSRKMTKAAMFRFLATSNEIQCSRAGFFAWVNKNVNFKEEARQRPLDLLIPRLDEADQVEQHQFPAAPTADVVAAPLASSSEGEGGRVAPDASDSATSSTTEKTTVESPSASEAADSASDAEPLYRRLARKALAELDDKDMGTVADRVLRNPPSGMRGRDG